MPCKSWSLPALETCPGSRDKRGELVEVCQGCYATTGMYHLPKVRFSREHNRHDWKRPEWADDMVAAIGKDPYFRWFDSGDVFHPKLAKKIREVIMRTPNTQHWLPTRCYKIEGIKAYLASIKKMKNACVRYSADKIGKFNKRHGSVVYDGDCDTDVPEGVTVCEAKTRGNTCGDCRNCWDKTIKVIGYPVQGVNMRNAIDRRAA